MIDGEIERLRKLSGNICTTAVLLVDKNTLDEDIIKEAEKADLFLLYENKTELIDALKKLVNHCDDNKTINNEENASKVKSAIQKAGKTLNNFIDNHYPVYICVFLLITGIINGFIELYKGRYFIEGFYTSFIMFVILAFFFSVLYLLQKKLPKVAEIVSTILLILIGIFFSLIIVVLVMGVISLIVDKIF